MAIKAWLLAGFFVPISVAIADDRPLLWGQGMQLCGVYAGAWQERELGTDEGFAAYGRFQDWFAGFVSGLSLATGMDVLHGLDITGAMRRINIHCEDNPDDDFFKASMDLIKLMSTVEAARTRRVAPAAPSRESPGIPGRR